MFDNQSDKAKNREVIEMLIHVNKILTRNGLVQQGKGDDEDKSFRQIGKLLSRHNSVMKVWIDDRSSRNYQTTYLRPDSQNEFISLLSEEVKNTVSDFVKTSGFCSIMADTAPDVTHSDELSVAVRYVDADTNTPKEWSVRIIKTLDKTGAGQVEDIVKCLKVSQLSYSKLTIQLQACLESSMVLKKG